MLFELAEKNRFLLQDTRPAFVLLTILWPMSWNFLEYSTLGFLFALCGYLQRHADRYSEKQRLWMLGLTFVFYEFTTCAVTITHPGTAGAILLTITMAATATCYGTTGPGPYRSQHPGRASDRFWRGPRYSLWIYALHLAVLHVITRIYF